MPESDNLSEELTATPPTAISGGILDGWTPPAWSPEGSLSMIIDPEDIASIDFSGGQASDGTQALQAAQDTVRGENSGSTAGNSNGLGNSQILHPDGVLLGGLKPPDTDGGSGNPPVQSAQAVAVAPIGALGDGRGAPATDVASGSNASANVEPSSTLTYDGKTHQLTLSQSDGTSQTFPANNNVDSRSQGRWPEGTYNYSGRRTHGPVDDSVNGKYGSYGGFEFQVPGRTGMEVHSGRQDMVDGLGRQGVDHATFGCIRTSDDGTAAIQDAVRGGYPVRRIIVQNNH